MCVKFTYNAGKDDTHVMISYQWRSQKTVFQIRDRLLAAGFKIWIDVENTSTYATTYKFAIV